MSAYSDTMNAGHQRRGQGRHSEARSEYERAVPLASGDDEKADALLHVAWSLCSEGNHLQAVSTFDKVLASYNCDPYKKSNAQLHSGYCFSHAQKPAEERAAYEKVASINGGNPWNRSAALISIAHLLLREGRSRYKEARAAFERLTKADDAHPHHVSDATNMIGHVFWWDSGDRYYRDARAWFERTLTVPGGHPHHLSASQVMIGHTYRHEGNYAVAIEEFLKVLGIEMGNPHHKSDAQLNIGHTYFDLQNHERAREEYQKVLAIKGAHEDHVRYAQARLGQIKA